MKGGLGEYAFFLCTNLATITGYAKSVGRIEVNLRNNLPSLFGSCPAPVFRRSQSAGKFKIDLRHQCDTLGDCCFIEPILTRLRVMGNAVHFRCTKRAISQK